MENEQEVIALENDTETTENEGEKESQIDVETLRKENETLKAQKEHWRKKAEEKSKVEAPKETKAESSLTAEDVLAFTGEGVTHKEDIELAKTWAKNSGKPVSEILSDETFKAVLGVKQEQRKTASTTQMKGGPKGVGRVSDEELLKKREKGELLSEEDLEKAIEYKYESKRMANKK